MLVYFIFKKTTLLRSLNFQKSAPLKSLSKLVASILPARRSSVRLPFPEEPSRVSSREKPSTTDIVGKDINKADSEENTLQTNLEGVDLQQESDPHVPQSDFFIYDETNSGNISNRHSDNKTKHSQFSPLPAPPPLSHRNVPERGTWEQSADTLSILRCQSLSTTYILLAGYHILGSVTLNQIMRIMATMTRETRITIYQEIIKELKIIDGIYFRKMQKMLVNQILIARF